MSIDTSPREDSLYERIGGEAAITAAVGIFFGLWPAQRAARLEPIDALRYE